MPSFRTAVERMCRFCARRYLRGFGLQELLERVIHLEMAATCEHKHMHISACEEEFVV
jgi:hypothetical protein